MSFETVEELIRKNQGAFRNRDPLEPGALGGVTLFIGPKSEAKIVADDLQRRLHADSDLRVAEEEKHG
ncbi:hypothetical protein [Chromobacterium paludis]|uniref:Uncharacterized protein n=1 Tax=Chromobacterium paludis TaxID=2605945 RepID=A0A5C1DFP7_9NEIS|nr:hypothetical protein [Chromobacterium paludis]QEL55476.1 hypothetical protein FYK34_07815 [Chromobacterium paludis]